MPNEGRIMRVTIAGGHVIDPANGIDMVTDVHIEGEHIAAVGRAPKGFKTERSIDAKGLVVTPGFVELSARMGEPGYTHKGTEADDPCLATGGRTLVDQFDHRRRHHAVLPARHAASD
jgi:dihydroorotase